MKNKTLKLILVAILTLSALAPSAQTNAVPTNTVKLDLNPLQASSTATDSQGETITSTDLAILSDWSTSSTEDLSMFWSLSINENILNTQCLDGSGNPKITKVSGSFSIISAQPDNPLDDNFAYINFLNFIGAYAFSLGGSGGGGSNDTEVGLSGVNASVAIPFDLNLFNTAGFIASINHTSNGTTLFEVTTKAPELSVSLSCDIEDGTASNGDISPSTSQSDNVAKTKSPKTGASEVLLGTFFVALIASSYVVYKAIEKHRKTTKVSEK